MSILITLHSASLFIHYLPTMYLLDFVLMRYHHCGRSNSPRCCYQRTSFCSSCHDPPTNNDGPVDGDHHHSHVPISPKIQSVQISPMFLIDSSSIHGPVSSLCECKIIRRDNNVRYSFGLVSRIWGRRWWWSTATRIAIRHNINMTWY